MPEPESVPGAGTKGGTSLFRLSCLVLSILAVCGAAFGADQVWKLVQEGSGVSVYARDVIAHPIHEYLGIGEVAEPPEVIGAALMDVPSFKKWFYRCREIRTLEARPGFDYVIHITIDSPWPFADRDVVVDADTEIDLDRMAFRVHGTPTTHPDAPEVPGVVRIAATEHTWTVEPLADGGTRVGYQHHTDPGGDVPSMFANIACRVLAHQSLVNFAEVVRSPVYEKEAREVLERLREEFGGAPGHAR
ncbi:MAG: START domain-containing protein [Desulfatibacillaceae bacterium]